MIDPADWWGKTASNGFDHHSPLIFLLPVESLGSSLVALFSDYVLARKQTNSHGCVKPNIVGDLNMSGVGEDENKPNQQPKKAVAVPMARALLPFHMVNNPLVIPRFKWTNAQNEVGGGLIKCRFCSTYKGVKWGNLDLENNAMSKWGQTLNMEFSWFRFHHIWKETDF